MTEPTFTVAKQGYLVAITNEELESAQVWPVTLQTPQKLAKWQQRQAELHAQNMAALQALRLEHPTLDPILLLHSPDAHGECTGCDGGPDYGGDWPCRTIETIQEDM